MPAPAATVLLPAPWPARRGPPPFLNRPRPAAGRTAPLCRSRTGLETVRAPRIASRAAKRSPSRDVRDTPQTGFEPGWLLAADAIVVPVEVRSVARIAATDGRRPSGSRCRAVGIGTVCAPRRRPPGRGPVWGRTSRAVSASVAMVAAVPPVVVTALGVEPARVSRGDHRLREHGCDQCNAETLHARPPPDCVGSPDCLRIVRLIPFQRRWITSSACARTAQHQTSAPEREPGLRSNSPATAVDMFPDLVEAKRGRWFATVCALSAGRRLTGPLGQETASFRSGHSVATGCCVNARA